MVQYENDEYVESQKHLTRSQKLPNTCKCALQILCAPALKCEPIVSQYIYFNIYKEARYSGSSLKTTIY